MSNTSSYLILGAAAVAAYVYYNRQKQGPSNTRYGPLPIPEPLPKGSTPVALRNTPEFAIPATLDFPDDGVLGGEYSAY